MSTRSITHFLDESGEVEARIYRHSDGYPNGAGVDLLRFLDAEKTQTTHTGSRVGDPSYLAARYVVFLAQMFASSPDWDGWSLKGPLPYIPHTCPFDFLSVGVCKEDPFDIEYRYTVDVHGAVRCFEVDGQTTGPEVVMPLFDATGDSE